MKLTPEQLDKYLEVISKHGLVHMLIDKLITPENVKAAVEGFTAGAVKGANND